LPSATAAHLVRQAALELAQFNMLAASDAAVADWLASRAGVPREDRLALSDWAPRRDVP
jgi:hypothetical protein